MSRSDEWGSIPEEDIPEDELAPPPDDEIVDDLMSDDPDNEDDAQPPRDAIAEALAQLVMQNVAAQERAEQARERRAKAQQEKVETPPPELFFQNLDQFVHHLAILYARDVGAAGAELRWEPKWWESPEAVSRLEALWRAWEALRLDGALGMSVWWRDHADHHMSILLSASGPFKRGQGEARAGAPLPLEPVPEGFFAEEHL